MSGAKEDRDGLKELFKIIRKGDTLIVWRLDRLGRSLKHLIEVVKELDGRNCYFKSITENIDTTSSGGKLIFHIFGALAEFERAIIRERTLAGLASARSRGQVGGRPKKMDKNKIALAKSLHDDPPNSIGDICEVLDISKSTLYRYLQKNWLVHQIGIMPHYYIIDIEAANRATELLDPILKGYNQLKK